MRKLLGALAFLLAATQAHAQATVEQCIRATPTGPCNAVSASNPLPTTGGGSGGSAGQMQGNTASGTTDVGNPVKTGGVYNTTLPTLLNGQRGDTQMDSRGGTYVVMKDGGGSNSASVSNAGADGLTPTSIGALWGNSIGYYFNGTSLDRARGDTTNGAWVNVKNGNVGGFEFAVSNTPAVAAGAHASGQSVGGLQTIAAFRTAGGTGILNNISVWSKGGATAPLTLYIFNANPTGTTCIDNGAFVLGAADISKLIATTPPVLTPAVVGVGTTATSASQQLPVNVVNGDSTVNLYVCAVVGGSGMTPASTSDLIFKFAGVRD
jgi:hypothetical protein